MDEIKYKHLIYRLKENHINHINS